MTGRRTAGLVAAGLLAAGGILVGGAGPAAADCGPTNLNPWTIGEGGHGPLPVIADGSGISSYIEPGPDVDHPQGDPFSPEATTTPYEQFVWGGSEWPTGYNCETGPSDSVSLVLANMVLSGVSIGAAFVARVMDFTMNPDTAHMLDPFSRFAAGSIGAVFQPVFGVAIMVVAALALWRAHRGEIKAGVTQLGWVILLGTGVVFTIGHPTQIAPVVYRAGVTAVATVSSGAMEMSGGDTATTPHDAVAGAVHRVAVYDPWCAGMVGQPTGPSADKWCPTLYRAVTLDRAEYRTYVQHPERRAQILQAHADAFVQVAERMKTEDPAAYDALAGKKGTDRLGWAALYFFVLLALAVPTLICALLMLIGLCAVTVFVAALPLLAVASVWWPARGFLVNAAKYAAGQAVTAVLFGSVFVCQVGAIGGMLTAPGMSATVGAAVWLLLSAVLLWMLHPFRHVKSARPGKTKIGKSGWSIRGQRQQWEDDDETERAESWPGRRVVASGVSIPEAPTFVTAAAAAAGAVIGAAAGRRVPDWTPPTSPPNQAPAGPPAAPEPVHRPLTRVDGPPRGDVPTGMTVAGPAADETTVDRPRLDRPPAALAAAAPAAAELAEIEAPARALPVSPPLSGQPPRVRPRQLPKVFTGNGNQIPVRIYQPARPDEPAIHTTTEVVSDVVETYRPDPKTRPQERS